MTYYKTLNKNNRSCYGGDSSLPWNLPTQNPDGSWTPGDWMPKIEELELCWRGYHLTDIGHLLYWLDDVIYEAEPSREIIVSKDKIVCSSVRLVRKMHWDKRIALLFASDCAEHVLHIFDDVYSDDSRPRYAIETARLFADGIISFKEFEKVSDAAWNAVNDVKRVSAKTAAKTAGSIGISVETVTQEGEYAAGRFATEKIKTKVNKSVWTLTWIRAKAAEHEWQAQHLSLYLEGKIG